MRDSLHSGIYLVRSTKYECKLLREPSSLMIPLPHGDSSHQACWFMIWLDSVVSIRVPLVEK